MYVFAILLLLHSFAKAAQSLYLSYSMYEISYVKYHSDFYNIFCQNTYICQIFNDKTVVERVHLGEVELWHRRLHDRACVALLVESEEKENFSLYRNKTISP